MIDYLVYVLAYLVIGFFLGYSVSKPFRRGTGDKYLVVAGAIVLLWPVIVLAAIIVVVLYMLYFIARMLGKAMFWIDAPKEGENEET